MPEPPRVHYAENGTGIGFSVLRPAVDLTSGRETLGIVQQVQEPLMGASKHIQSGIHSPNLTDPSAIGRRFGAMRGMPFASRLQQRLGIAIRTPTVMHHAPPSGAPRPVGAAIPVQLRRAVGSARLLIGRLTPR